MGYIIMLLDKLLVIPAIIPGGWLEEIYDKMGLRLFESVFSWLYLVYPGFQRFIDWAISVTN